jgi:hypothetical protein
MYKGNGKKLLSFFSESNKALHSCYPYDASMACLMGLVSDQFDVAVPEKVYGDRSIRAVNWNS